VLARAFLLLALLTLATAAPAHADSFSDAQAALEQAAQQVGSSVGAPKDDGQKSWTESTANNGGVAAPTAPAPSTTTAEPAPATSAEPAPAPAVVAPAPTAAAPAPANVNITIRVKSPGNDGPTIQQVESGGISAADADRIEHDLQVQLDKKLKQLQRQMTAAPEKIHAPPTVSHPVQAPVRHVAKPHAVHRARAVHHVAPALQLPTVALAPPRATPHRTQHRTHAQRAVHRRHSPFQQLPQPFPDQAMSAGSSGGTSTPPPALFAVLLAAACFAASMLVTGLWDAHRRRRSRLFASRLERPG
jgi:hypothetical protein